MLKVMRLPEDGFAPIIVSIIIIVVLSLLTVGFVALSTNNQKSALNRQLNNDAFYAAETGINDASQAIFSGELTGNKTTCGTDPSVPYLNDNNVNPSVNNDYYSCLLINQTPNSLVYDNVTASQPTVVLLDGIDSSGVPQQITTVDISWGPSPQMGNSYAFAPNGSPGARHCRPHFPCFFPPPVRSWMNMCNSGPCFPPESQWNNGGKPIAGVLRVALTPLANGKGAPLPSDTTNTYTAFMYPLGGNGNTATPSSFTSSLGTAGGEVVSGNCSTTSTLAGNCNVSIDTSGAQADGGTPAGFLLSMESEYNPSRVTIQAYGSSGNLLEFKNAQAIIDSTGDDQGVLKRIEVRVPTTNMLGAPAFDDTSSGSLCKDISTYPYNHSTNTPGQTSSPCGL